MAPKDSPKRCPVCGGSGVQAFLRRPRGPAHQNLVVETHAAARGLASGPLELQVCDACGFVFNSAFDPARLSYGEQYENAQYHSPRFARHIESRVEHLIDERGVRDARIVEVGCGDGTFLRKLVEHPGVGNRGSGNRGWGFDPSYTGPDRQLDGRLRFERRFYDREAADLAADVVVCRHVIEHVPDPIALLRSVRSALEGSPRARIFFETPCVRWILENRVLWDFFYEHCSLFTAESLTTAFETAGFDVDAVETVFDGQYLWLEARLGAPGREVRRDPGDLPELARAFAADEARLKERWAHHLAEWRRAGPVVIWGAGAKGVTFANLVDPDARLVDCVVDVNPAKQGRYLPGTGHAIVSPEALGERKPAVALVLNPSYVGEIQASLRELGLGTRVVDLMGTLDESGSRPGSQSGS